MFFKYFFNILLYIAAECAFQFFLDDFLYLAFEGGFWEVVVVVSFFILFIWELILIDVVVSDMFEIFVIVGISPDWFSEVGVHAVLSFEVVEKWVAFVHENGFVLFVPGCFFFGHITINNRFNNAVILSWSILFCWQWLYGQMQNEVIFAIRWACTLEIVTHLLSFGRSHEREILLGFCLQISIVRNAISMSRNYTRWLI